MEPSLYSDTEASGPDSNVNKLKRSMTLDFNSSSAAKQKKLATVLASPDLNMLKLASPELEKMIIQANGMVTTTPTPTQFVFPKCVTEEQEAYARGFVDALAKLQATASNHQLAAVAQNSKVITQGIRPGGEVDPANPPHMTVPASLFSSALTVPSALSQIPAAAASGPQLLPSGYDLSVPPSSEVATTTSLPGGNYTSRLSSRSVTPPAPPKNALPSSISNIPTTANNYDMRVPHKVIKEEPQTVPCLSSSPPLSPINMESQEKIKLERKRARNRVAARKCRTRKLERISRLEDRVADLKGQNNDLASTALGLREQVNKLKQTIVEHVSSGCHIMMTQNISFGEIK